jgi:hypothetical protein
MTRAELLPNLGAEEGGDWQAYRSEARVRVAARLWSLLFSRDHALHGPGTSDKEAMRPQACEVLWPSALGPAPAKVVFDWLAASDGATAWLNTESVEREARARFASGVAGPSPACVARVHDKAFAIEAARELGLFSRDLEATIQIIEPESLGSSDALVATLDAALREWPEWTGRAFTLKPRLGSSGRGRVSGTQTLDRKAIRGAFPRLANRGGAILEPWLSRKTDLSVSLFVPKPGEPEQQVAATTILGTLELLVTTSGVYRGHCGEVDSRGRVFSGHRDDETLRADAAAVANQARAMGFFGPCGVDAFTYFQSESEFESEPERSRERLRSLVEFNGRMTMGGVAIGLVRRALPQVRERLELTPGLRRGFLLTFVEPDASHDVDALVRAGGADTIAIDLSSPGFESEGRPILLFARDRDPLREAHRALFGC